MFQKMLKEKEFFLRPIVVWKLEMSAQDLTFHLIKLICSGPSSFFEKFVQNFNFSKKMVVAQWCTIWYKFNFLKKLKCHFQLTWICEWIYCTYFSFSYLEENIKFIYSFLKIFYTKFTIELENSSNETDDTRRFKF